MSTLYRPLPELIFSTSWFRRLSANAKLIVLTLAAGPCMTGCPGLAVADAYLLVSLTGLAVVDVQTALDEMTSAKVLEVDDEHRLIRLPWLPAMRRTKSYKDLIGWWKCFVERPPCALRDAHVATLRDAVDFGGEQMESAWSQTFGGKPSGSPPQAHDKPSGTPADHGDGDGDGTEEEIAADAAALSDNQPPALKLVAVQAPQAARNHKAKATPLPYRVDELTAELATSSGGRFISSVLTTKRAIAAQKLVRAYTLDQVRLAGEWLGAGGDDWKGALDVRQLGDLPVWIAHAKDWSDKGRPALGGKRDSTGQSKDAKPNRPQSLEDLRRNGYGDGE